MLPLPFLYAVLILKHRTNGAGAFIGHNLNRDELINELGNVRYVQVSLRVSPNADNDFVDALMADADRLYRVGNIFLQRASSFSDLRYISELEDVNEVKTQLCILFFLMLNIFLGVIGTFWFRTQHRRREVVAYGNGIQSSRYLSASDGRRYITLDSSCHPCFDYCF